jgi:hypothetical protein
VIDNMNAALRLPFHSLGSYVKVRRSAKIVQLAHGNREVPCCTTLSCRTFIASTMRRSVQRLKAREVENHPFPNITHIVVGPRGALAASDALRTAKIIICRLFHGDALIKASEKRQR